jgi:hypothetical protein
MDYQEKFAALTRAIAPHLRADLDPETYAAGMLEEAAEDDQEHFEVRGLHTRTGNPYTFTI